MDRHAGTHWREEAVRDRRVGPQDGGRHVVALVAALEEEQVAQRLRRAGRVRQQEAQLAEARRGRLGHLHERLIVQRDGVQLLLQPRGHVAQRLARRLVVPEREFDGGLSRVVWGVENKNITQKTKQTLNHSLLLP